MSTLAVSVGEEPETVEDVYEPFLLQAGLVMRTPRGRLAAPGAYVHLGLEVPVQLSMALSAGGLDPSPTPPPRGGRGGAAAKIRCSPQRLTRVLARRSRSRATKVTDRIVP